jgi:uncharacterized membrane protein
MSWRNSFVHPAFVPVLLVSYIVAIAAGVSMLLCGTQFDIKPLTIVGIAIMVLSTFVVLAAKDATCEIDPSAEPVESPSWASETA